MGYSRAFRQRVDPTLFPPGSPGYVSCSGSLRVGYSILGIVFGRYSTRPMFRAPDPILNILLFSCINLLCPITETPRSGWVLKETGTATYLLCNIILAVFPRMDPHIGKYCSPVPPPLDGKSGKSLLGSI